eukprot:GILJ01006988.1.p1 GENE.GILJ01006988.1~~GILJ01006988.1.p1  ORF type:complete len:683 (+),score=100.94 GILJ01006988.1:121-2169(+)
MSYQDTCEQGVLMLVKQEDEPHESSDEEIDMNVVPVEAQSSMTVLESSDFSKTDQASNSAPLCVAAVSNSLAADKTKLGLLQKSVNSVSDLNYDVQDLKQSLQEFQRSTGCQDTKLETFLPRLVSRLETDIAQFLTAIDIFVHLGPTSSSSQLSDGTSSPEHTEDWYQTIENMDVAPLLPPPPPLPPMYHLYRSAFEYDKESIVNTSPLPGVDSDSEDDDIEYKTTRTPFVRSPASISETSSDIEAEAEADSECDSDCTDPETEYTSCSRHNVHKKQTSLDMELGISSDSETDARVRVGTGTGAGIGAGGAMLRYSVSMPTKRPRSAFIQGTSSSKINKHNLDNRKRRGKLLGDICKAQGRVEPRSDSRASSKSRKQPMFGVPKALESRDNDDICGFCLIGGDLLCCDGRCFRSFHLECLGLTSLPKEDDWVCPDCKKLPEDRYIVEKVLKTAVRNGVRQFFVKWKGYPDSKNSWALDVSPELIAIFEASKSKKGNKKRKRHNTSEAPSKKKKAKTKKDTTSASAAGAAQEETEDVWIINTPSGQKWRWVGRNRAHAPIKTDLSVPIKTDISIPIETDISVPIKTDISVLVTADTSLPLKTETAFVDAPTISIGAPIQTVVDELTVCHVQPPVTVDLSVVGTVSSRPSPTVIDLCDDSDMDVVVTIDSSPESRCNVNTVISV